MTSTIAVRLRTPEIIDFIENMYMYNGSPLGKQSIIILGPPGIGKSESVAQAAERIARKLNKKFIKYGSTVIIFSDWVLYDYGDPEVWRLLNRIAHTARLIEVTTYNSPIPIPSATVIRMPIEVITTQPISK